MAENRRPTPVDRGNSTSSSLTFSQNTTESENEYDIEYGSEGGGRALRANQNALNDASAPASPTKTTPKKTAAPRPEKRIDFARLAAARTPRGSARRPRGLPAPEEAVQDAVERERAALEIGTQRLQLISPPPEETLSLRRHSRLSSGGAGTLAPPKNLGETMEGEQVADKANKKSPQTAKRKRTVQPQPQKPLPVDEEAMDVDDSATAAQSTSQPQRREEDPDAGAVEATPNPKPRKMRHVRAQSNESPTKARKGKSAARDEDEEMEDAALAIRATPKSRPSAARSTTPTMTTTPTKPRSTIVQSPYAKNPDADWIPPVPATALASAPARRAVLGARGSRRSATPIPAYEPPTDVFTPPKEVFLTPRAVEGRRTPATGRTAAKKGASARKSRASTLRVDTVKQELPDNIDLTAPMPPPSPSDDPLLLSGPPEPEWASSPLRGAARRREAREQARPVQIETVAEEEEEDDGVLPPSSPEPPLDSEDTRAVGAFQFDAPASMETEDSMMQVDPADADVAPVQLFGEGGGEWSDSDEEMDNCVEEGEGEYTGKWRTIRVPTKQDPPSSATRERMDKWGRPISPYPYPRKKLDFLREDEEEREEEEVRQMSLEPEQSAAPPAASPPSPVNVFAFPSLEDAEAQTEVQAPVEEDAEEEDDSSTDDEPGFVKITSSDPRAAARAAAILKQHDYECYTKLLLKKHRRASHSGVEDLARGTRRRDLSAAAITKSSFKNKNRRKSTLGISVIDDQVFIPGTPVTTLPALLQEAEKEVERELDHEHKQTPSKVWAARAVFEGAYQRDLFKTPLPAGRPSLLASKPDATPMPLPLPVYNAAGDRVWTKEEWRLLDACFTDQRIDVGETLPGAEEGTLAPVDMIKMEDVVDRFVVLLGGKSVVVRWGEAWEREDLLERARALQNKQRSGRIARPSTPRSPFLFSARPSLTGSSSNVTVNRVHIDNYSSQPLRPTSIEVPDFTPLFNRRVAPHPRKSKLSSTTTLPAPVATSTILPSRPTLPAPVTENAPFSRLQEEDEDTRTPYRMPRSLLAPRYSHLLEEAVKVSQQGVFPVPVPAGVAVEQEQHSIGQDADEVEQEQGDEYEQEHEHEHDSGAPGTPQHPVATAAPAPPSTLRNRVKGFLFSYLPTRTAKPAPSAIPTRALKPARPGLPLPPPSVLARTRGPVATPARPPVPRPRAPKELVELHHAPPPPAVPRAGAGRKEPRRLVELARVPPPVERPVVVREREARPRRSSGSSVRDLVRGFEEMEHGASVGGSVREKGPALARTKSGSELRARWRAGQPDGRPKWKV